MKTSTRQIRHLTDANLNYIVMSGAASDIRIGDLIFDGTMWVRGLGADAALGVPAVRLDLEAWSETPEIVGLPARLSLPTGAPVEIVRLVATPAVDAPMARFDPASSADGAERTAPTINLQPGDRVVFYGDDAEVKKAHPNGLVLFAGGGAHQSAPDLFWGVLPA